MNELKPLRQVFQFIYIQQIFSIHILHSLEQKSNVLMHVFCAQLNFFKGDEIDRGVNYRDSNVQMNGPFFGIKETGFQM